MLYKTKRRPGRRAAAFMAAALALTVPATTAQAAFKTIHPMAFAPSRASAATVADFLQTWETGELKGDSCYNAGVDLPNGSLITQLRVFYSNGGGDSPILRLVATKIGTGVSTFLVDVALPDTGNARVSKAYETGHKVNTKKYLYGIGFCPFNDGAFFGVRIKYKPG